MPSLSIILIIINMSYNNSDLPTYIQMDKRIFEVMIFQQDNLIYYSDFIQKNRDYEQLK